MKSNKKLVPNENSQIWSTSRAHHSSHVRPGQMKKKKKSVQEGKREKQLSIIGTHEIKIKNTAQETKEKKKTGELKICRFLSETFRYDYIKFGNGSRQGGTTMKEFDPADFIFFFGRGFLSKKNNLVFT